MRKLPPRNLPESAIPWARAVEHEIEETETSASNLADRLRAAEGTIESQAQQLQTLQNYIRTICGLAGFTYPPAAAPPPPPPPPVGAPPAPVSKTIEVGADWSATWYQSFKRTTPGGTHDDSRSLYQRGSGYTFSMWRFNVAEAAGKNITGVQMFLSNISTYYNGNFVLALGTHGSVGEPASRPGGGRANGFDVGWTAGEARWLPVPEWAWAGLSNGSIQGFTMGDLNRDTQNFARFNGVGRSGAPVLRITFDV